MKGAVMNEDITQVEDSELPELALMVDVPDFDGE